MNYPVAVIIPVYKNDTPQYVRPAIDSIIKQTYSCRIYIGVDGPIGNSLNSCLEAYENNKNVSIVRFAENRGLACVLNDLLQICFDNGYEYIARMDADDISLPDRIEKQICFLNEHPEIDVVGGLSTKSTKKVANRENNRLSSDSHRMQEIFAKRNPLAHPAVLFRKSFLIKSDIVTALNIGKTKIRCFGTTA